MKNNVKNKFFSQNGQDKFLEEKILKNIDNGYFIDIGANDGITFSNTYFFENKGWRGVCIEPIPEVFNKLQTNRNCDCILGVISEKSTPYSKFLHITGEVGTEMLSGIFEEYDSKHIERIEKELKTCTSGKEIIEVKNYNFNTIITELNIDYLSIDTEGSEFSIIKSIDFSKFNIKVISIENDYRDKRIHDLLKKNNYKFLKTIGSDELYINKKYIKYLSKKILFFLLFIRLYKIAKRIIKKIWINVS